MAHNTLHSRSYLTHTNFRDQPDEYEPLDVFTEGDEDGYVWPSEPVLPLNGDVVDVLDSHYEETRRGL